MNAYFKHHKDNIRLQYRCFDRLLLNGLRACLFRLSIVRSRDRLLGWFWGGCNVLRTPARLENKLIQDAELV
jgi:hypothetical protein